MPSATLDNLVNIGKLKVEPPDQKEFDGLVRSAGHRLIDAGVTSLSEESQFTLAYGAAHALAVAALRWHGYRADARYLVFQCLQQTVGLENAQWRVLDKCHKQRNLAEYEGHLEVTPQLIAELIGVTREVQSRVVALGAIK
ncbi:MAG TPA: hypothetical protein VIM96_08915 [Pseudomonadales bacterium]